MTVGSFIWAGTFTWAVNSAAWSLSLVLSILKETYKSAMEQDTDMEFEREGSVRRCNESDL